MIWIEVYNAHRDITQPDLLVLQLKYSTKKNFSKFILGVPVLRRGKPRLQWTLSHLQRELIIASTPHCNAEYYKHFMWNPMQQQQQVSGSQYWGAGKRLRSLAVRREFCFRRAMGDAQTSQSGCVPSNWIALQCSEQWLTPEGGILGRIFVAIFDL